MSSIRKRLRSEQWINDSGNPQLVARLALDQFFRKRQVIASRQLADGHQLQHLVRAEISDLTLDTAEAVLESSVTSLSHTWVSWFQLAAYVRTPRQRIYSKLAFSSIRKDHTVRQQLASEAYSGYGRLVGDALAIHDAATDGVHKGHALGAVAELSVIALLNRARTGHSNAMYASTYADLYAKVDAWYVAFRPGILGPSGMNLQIKNYLPRHHAANGIAQVSARRFLDGTEDQLWGARAIARDVYGTASPSDNIELERRSAVLKSRLHELMPNCSSVLAD